MQNEVHFNPSFGMLELKMAKGDVVHAEAGAMVALEKGINMITKARGGILSSLKRSVLGGESFFVNEFKCEGEGGSLLLSPACDGAVSSFAVSSDQALFIQSGGYLAHTGDLEIDSKWGGAKTFFSRKGLFVLKASGNGDVFFNSYGALHRVDLNNEGYIVDTGYLVAWTEGLDYKVTKIGGLKSFFFSGEGLVCHLRGTGSVWVQTRSPDALAAFLHPFRRVEKKKSVASNVVDSVT